MKLENSKGVERIGHTALRVKDLDRSKSFYMNLGMNLIWDDKDWCYLEAGTELKNVDGVSNAVVDFESATASIEFNPGLVSEAGLLEFVNDYKDSSYKATTILAQKSDKSKTSCCASKVKACSSDKKVSANKEEKSCSESKTIQ